MKEGFTCECGKYHEFGVWVAAHWRELLVHICDACGRKHETIMGHVTLVKSRKKREKK